ncbi:glycosyltransferase family 4 protein [Thermodesulfovibrionales bacterium]|nr:glycosyltransferase family 4 protein [Thermodesulfovibrionales bacterium]
MDKFKIIILHNIISPYKTLLFNSLEQILGGNLKVLYWAETAGNRKWRIDTNELKFPFDVLFKGKIDDINSIKLAIETYKKLNLYNPEVVIIGGYDRLACWAALFWAKKHKRKAIVMIESHYLDRPRSAIKENIKKLFISRCDAILAAGTRHRDYVIRLGAKSENIFIMKGVGGVNLSLYQTAVLERRKNKIELCNELGAPYKNYFLYVGRFSPEKNLLFLLKTYERLKNKERTDNWGLILVGDGPQRKEIESFVKDKGIKNVFFPGFIQKEKLPYFYTISDVFVLPSISETWGLVVDEAMVSGLPVLVSNRCGCYPDIVQDGVNGFSFDPLNEDELFRLMEDIARGRHDLEAMGRASLEIIKDYTPEKTAEMCSNAISFVLNREEKI